MYRLLTGNLPIGANIMLNKPSKLSSTFSSGTTFISSYATDGGPYCASTNEQQDPYWEGDLQGFYTVGTVYVTSGLDNVWTFPEHLRLAKVGVSVQDANCPEGMVIQCGQWPDEFLPAQTMAFNCSHAGPVRFVRVWREGYGRISLCEVEVVGQPMKIKRTYYDRFTLEKISSPIVSLTADSVTDCGTMCVQNQPCIAFSYNPLVVPSCLLATDVAMTSDVTWDSYRVNSCFRETKCL